MALASHTVRVAIQANIQKEEGARVAKHLSMVRNGILTVTRVVVLLSVLIMALLTIIIMMAGRQPRIHQTI